MGKLAPNQTGRLPGGVPRTPSQRCAQDAFPEVCCPCPKSQLHDGRLVAKGGEAEQRHSVPSSYLESFSPGGFVSIINQRMWGKNRIQ